MNSITAITVNFKTPLLVSDCLTTFAAHYPDVPHIVIDNGGCPRSLRVLRRLKDKAKGITLVENRCNVGHGPALNQGLALTGTPHAFLLDSDTRTEKGEFLEKMLRLFTANPRLFATGWLRYVDPLTGVAHLNQQAQLGHPYVHPYACLLDMAKFRKLEPFAHRGAPAVRTMVSAVRARYVLVAFPVEHYVWHKVAGTRGLFDGRCRVGTDEVPRTWRKRDI